MDGGFMCDEKKLNNSYCSPRWSNEILDCSMPMTFDTYNKCSFNCLYCFSYFQKEHSLGDNYQELLEGLKTVNVEKIKKLFDLDESTPKNLKQFFSMVKNKKVMQWGGLADQFDMYEKKYNISLELLKIFKEKNYPLCFSTKSVWWLYDERYIKLFKNQDNWNVKFSIINLDEEKAKLMEKGCPPPMDRLKAIKEYSKLNKGGATLRLRPFIIGLTDYNDEYLDLIKLAKENGATAVSTEFFCLESRMSKSLKKKYDEMSNIIGFDIYQYYRENSSGSGYLRLNYNLKSKYINKMKDLCDKLSLRFYVSDAHHKEKCNNGSCCGLNSDWNYNKGQFTEALLIAKNTGFVSWDDIKAEIIKYFNFSYVNAEGFNTKSNRIRVEYKGWTMVDWIQEKWNNPYDYNSPYNYFQGKLYPDRLDKNKNVIYTYIEDNSYYLNNLKISNNDKKLF